VEAAELLGAKATLRKPIDKDRLLQTVREVLNGG
jgi:DNA-binding NarL/FixJ family response regulator